MAGISFFSFSVMLLVEGEQMLAFQGSQNDGLGGIALMARLT